MDESTCQPKSLTANGKATGSRAGADGLQSHGGSASIWPCNLPEFDGSGLDRGIRLIVEALVRAGVETVESCEGGDGHHWKRPTVLFRGDAADGYYALAVALKHNFPVWQLRRTWVVRGGITGISTAELQEPLWELVFIPTGARGNQRTLTGSRQKPSTRGN